MKIIEYNDPRFKSLMQNIQSFGHGVNKVIKENSMGKGFDFTKVQNGHHEVTDKRNGQTIGVKYNSLIPNAELFSLALDLVQPAIEEFEASNIFVSDSGFLPGAEVVGADILSRTGQARLSARGVERGDIPRADISVGRKTQVIGKMDAYARATIDDIQRIAARTSSGLAPIIELMSEKLNSVRWFIGRERELLVWRGGIIETKNIGINSIFSYFSTTAGDYNATAPAFGKQSVVATKEGAVTWLAKLALPSGKGAMYIQEDLADAISYVQRLGTYKVSHIIMPRFWINKLSLIPYSSLNPTPILTIIKQAMPGVEFVGTTALDYAYNTDLTALKSGFIAIDARKQNWVIADPEPINFLPAFVDKEGTVEQVGRMQSAGVLSKHPSSAAFYTGIDT